jgi:hypothetical protein
MFWHHVSTDGSQVPVEWRKPRKIMAAGVVTATTRLRQARSIRSTQKRRAAAD